jgi:hypothetical protein
LNKKVAVCTANFLKFHSIFTKYCGYHGFFYQLDLFGKSNINWIKLKSELIYITTHYWNWRYVDSKYAIFYSIDLYLFRKMQKRTVQLTCWSLWPNEFHKFIWSNASFIDHGEDQLEEPQESSTEEDHKHSCQNDVVINFYD